MSGTSAELVNSTGADPSDPGARAPATQNRSIVFLTRDLDLGGAQRQLVALAKGLHEQGRKVTVVVFYENSALQPELEQSGVRVVTIGKRSRWDLIGFGWRLLRFVRRERPGVLHGYLWGPNAITVAFKPFLRGTRAVWGVRASTTDFSKYNWFERVSFRANCWLSPFADLIIANSWSGAEDHRQHGYPARTLAVVPNGIAIERFRPDSAARRAIRQEWGVGDDQSLVGLVARLDPMKGHATFLKAASILSKQMPNVRFACVGTGSESYTRSLHALSAELGLEGKVMWIGARMDMERVQNAFDVACSASDFGEGFSNTIGEAMASGVPCVVTPVGDSARIVDGTGMVVPPRDADALAAAIRRSIATLTPERREACRRRIEENFTVPLLVDRTAKLLWPDTGASS